MSTSDIFSSTYLYYYYYGILLLLLLFFQFYLLLVAFRLLLWCAKTWILGITLHLRNRECIVWFTVTTAALCLRHGNSETAFLLYLLVYFYFVYFYVFVLYILHKTLCIFYVGILWNILFPNFSFLASNLHQI